MVFFVIDWVACGIAGKVAADRFRLRSLSLPCSPGFPDQPAQSNAPALLDGWSLVLQERGWLQARMASGLAIIGIALGTIAGFAVFVSAGTQLVDFLIPTLLLEWEASE